eukprot:352653-Pyramimonas_sp.AAC.1
MGKPTKPDSEGMTSPCATDSAPLPKMHALLLCSKVNAWKRCGLGLRVARRGLNWGDVRASIGRLRDEAVERFEPIDAAL